MKLSSGKQKREHPGEFKGRFSADGGMVFSDFTRSKLKRFILENPNMPFELKPTFPESAEQRGWFEGALCPLVAFYQENMDHRESKDREKVREWLKIEFNGDLVAIGGKTHMVAQSTKNRLNLGFLERCTDWLVDNYAPPFEALDTNSYKNWRDTIYPEGGPDNYIDYLLERKILTK